MPTIKIDLTYGIGDKVWFKLATEPEDMGIVTGILFRSANQPEYEVTWGDKMKGWYLDCELSKDKPIIY